MAGNRNVLNFRERDLRRAIRAHLKEGLVVSRSRIDREGNIDIEVGDQPGQVSKTKNEWDGEYGPPSAA